MGIKTHNQMVINLSRWNVLNFAARDCRSFTLPIARQAIAVRDGCAAHSPSSG
jgi:hypothetical protein